MIPDAATGRWREVALVAVTGLCASAPLAAADWQFTPRTLLSSGYVGNPRYVPEGGNDEFQTSADVSAQLQGGTERLKLSVAPRATASRNRSDQTLDINNQYLALSSAWQNERSSWTAAAQASRDTTQSSELGTTGLVQDNQRREYLTLSAGPRLTLTESLSAGATGQWSKTRYVDGVGSGLTDFTRTTASVFGGAVLGDQTSMSVSAQGGVLQVVSRTSDTRDAGISLGISHRLGPTWQLSASAGPSWVDNGFRKTRSTSFSADLSKRGELLQLSLGVSRQLSPIGLGALTEADSAQLSATYALTELVSLTAAANWSRNRDILGDPALLGQDTRFVGVNGSLGWTFSRHWAMSLDVLGREQRTGVGTPFAVSADSYRVSVGISWNGRTVIL